jgi:hypothetical protein
MFKIDYYDGDLAYYSPLQRYNRTRATDGPSSAQDRDMGPGWSSTRSARASLGSKLIWSDGGYNAWQIETAVA